MKKTNLINREIFPKRLFMSAFAGAAFLFLIANTSCKKGSLDSRKADQMALMNAASNHGHQHVNVRSMGAAADGITDDTRAFQKAIDLVAAHGGGTVWVPPGSYSINADTSIILKSNVIFSMADSARLIADTSSRSGFYYVIKIINVHDAKVLGGQIIGDRDIHNGSRGEHGMGIGVQGSDRIEINGTRISKCWGDGLYVGSAGGSPSTNIIVKNVSCKYNRRQGLSIIEVNGVTVDSCEFAFTSGTAPSDGIDIEPNSGTAQNITITHCDMYSNKGSGVEINARNGNIIKNVTIQYNKIHSNPYSAYCQRADSVVFTNNWLYGNKYEGNHPHNSRCTNSVFSPNTYAAP